MNFFAAVSKSSTFNPVTAESLPSLTVEARVADGVVDRPIVCSWSVSPDRLDLVGRLSKAIFSGKATPNPEVKTDVSGETYVDTDFVILGRTMNADLKRLGF